MQLPIGWLQCPLEFVQPLRDHRLLVCKTPIDPEIAEHFKVPKAQRFAPHTIYTLPTKHHVAKLKAMRAPSSSASKREVGLVIDLTNMKWYDEMAFNNGKKTNKVRRRVIVMDDLEKPSEQNINSFVGLVSSFLEGANNQDKWIVVHDDLGFNLSGFFVCAFMVRQFNYSVDAAVYQFGNARKPGIFHEHFIRKLHELFSDPEDLEVFEQMLKLKPLVEPEWYPAAHRKVQFIQRPGAAAHSASSSTVKNLNMNTQSAARNSQFAVPTTSITNASSSQQNANMSSRNTAKRAFSEMNTSSTPNGGRGGGGLLQEPSLLSDPTPIREPRSMDNGHRSSSSQSPSSADHVIQEPDVFEPVEPTLFEPQEPTLLGVQEPPRKRPRTMDAPPTVPVHVPPELKGDHPYLVAVRDQHLQHLTQIVLQLSKTQDLFHSICNKPVTVKQATLMGLKANYRISWLGHGHRFWLMILGKMGAFFVDPSFFSTGKLGGIYHIEGTKFHDARHQKDLDGTLCCGELVVDHIVTNKATGATKKVPRFLITDLLVFDKQSLSKFPHTERLNRAENYLYKSCAKSLQRSKLRVRVKPMYMIENADIVGKLQRMIDKELPHKCDGLGLWPIKPPFGQRMLRIAL